ncbi:MAG: hypothetical protein MZV70_45880 [Desulfobacterales bacterium]|nr:hypothetical protein [Desulfobacterales bacterium]
MTEVNSFRPDFGKKDSYQMFIEMQNNHRLFDPIRGRTAMMLPFSIKQSNLAKVELRPAFFLLGPLTLFISSFLSHSSAQLKPKRRSSACSFSFSFLMAFGRLVAAIRPDKLCPIGTHF